MTNEEFKSLCYRHTIHSNWEIRADLFQKIMKEAVARNSVRKLAEEFGVSDSCVEQWAEGKAKPKHLVECHVVDTIIKSLDHETPSQ